VLGVPTLYLLDKDGIVLEKTDMWEDVLKHINIQMGPLSNEIRKMK